jgi:hypothetical protein
LQESGGNTLRTFTTTATVQNGKLIVELPPDFEGHRVSVQVADSEPKPESKDAETSRRTEATLHKLSSLLMDVPVAPHLESINRELVSAVHA